MAGKITFSQLCALVAESAQTPRKETEDFLRELFSEISNSLATGETVKLKGIGTFKVQKVSERRSVNVTTGQEMIIPGHSKITFVASKELSQIVNAPFQAFEAVELADGISEQELEEEAVEATAEIEEFEKLSTPSSEAIAEDRIEETAVVKSDDNDDNDDNDNIVDNDYNDDNIAEDSVTEQIAQPPTHIHPSHSFSMKGFWFGISVGIAMAAIAFIIILFTNPTLYNTLRGDKPDSATSKSNFASVAPAEIKERPKAKEENVIEETKTEITPEVPTEASEPIEKKNAEVGPIYDRISKTRYLTTMAKEHYGNYHLWPYIYIENQKILGHPDRIKPGTRVVVPSLEKYGVDAKNPEDIAKAKQMGIDIYARYNGKKAKG